MRHIYLNNFKSSVDDFVKMFNLVDVTTNTVSAMKEERFEEAFSGKIYDKINSIMEEANGNK